jgi:Zn-dependent M28 family amino/carboxypeptidase
MARELSAATLPRTVRFVAFADEEPPFFYTGEMASRVYAAQCRQRGEQIVAMLSLEIIGFCTDAAGSQRYPFPFNLLYPDTGNSIGFVGNLSSRHLVRQAIDVFRRSTRFPSEGVATPGWITSAHWLDHWSAWQEGYSAIMIADTALLRYQHHHSSEDTPERLDYARLARVVGGLAQVVKGFAGRGGG